MPRKGGKPTVAVFDTNMGSKRGRVPFPCREVSQAHGHGKRRLRLQSETTLPVANGRPLHSNFLSLQACVAYLTDQTLSDFVVDEVPAGVKENTWFLVRRHVTAAGAGVDKFWDDCGAWTQHHGWKSHHLRDSVTEVRVMEDGLYGTRRRVDGKRAMVRIDPQPTDVLCVHRMYTKHGTGCRV